MVVPFLFRRHLPFKVLLTQAGGDMGLAGTAVADDQHREGHAAIAFNQLGDLAQARRSGLGDVPGFIDRVTVVAPTQLGEQVP